MTNIKLDSRVMSNLKNEKLIAMLNEVIDNELDKDASQVDNNLVEECIDLVLKLEQEDDDSFVALVPLVTSDEFLSRIAPNKNVWKRLNVFARAAVVAAIVTTGTFTVNAAVKAITDYDIIGEITKQIVSIIHTDKSTNEIDFESGFELQNEATTDSAAKNQEDKKEKTSGGFIIYNVSNDKENSQANIADNLEAESVSPTTPNKQPTKHPNKVVIPTVPSGGGGNKVTPSEKQLVGVYVDSTNMKTNYIYGEELCYDGIELYCVYDDDSREWLDYKKCDRTENLDTTKSGDYIVKIVYQNTLIEIDVSVRPNEETRYSTICANDDYDYLLTQKGAYITKYKGASKNIVLDKIDSNDVYSIEQRVFEKSNIESFSSSTLKRVSNSAFANCENLKTFEAPNLKILSDRALKNTALETVEIAKGVSSIGDYAFYNCSKLKEVQFLGNVSTVGKYAFCECAELEKITGTSDITRVGDFAFYDNKQMVLDSPLSKLNYAGEYSFAFCSKVQIDSVDNMIFIGDGAFKLCPNIKSVHITKNIKSIPYEAFRGVKMQSLTIDEGVEAVEDYAFMSTSMTNLTLPDSLKSIGDYAFYSNKLRNVYGGDYVKTIGNMAFYPTNKIIMHVLIGSPLYNYSMENGMTIVPHNSNGEILPPEQEL